MGNTEERLKEIKRRFRLFMNGEVSRSLRDKGMDYHIIWGVSLNHLKMMAAEYGEDFELASALWNENIRECRILATLIMPKSQMDRTLAMTWINGLKTMEEAELCAFNLFRSLPFAYDLSVECLLRGNELQRICSYNVLCRLLPQLSSCDKDSADVIVKTLEKDLASEKMGLRHSAYNCLNRFVMIDAACAEQGEKIIADIESQTIREKS